MCMVSLSLSIYISISLSLYIYIYIIIYVHRQAPRRQMSLPAHFGRPGRIEVNRHIIILKYSIVGSYFW